MWIQCLILFFTLSVSFGDKSECQKAHPEECAEVSDLLPEEFPEDSEELKDQCETYKLLARCIWDFKKTCPGKEDEVKFYHGMLTYLEQVCEETSDVFQVISENLECIKNSVNAVTEVCDWGNLSEESQMSLYTYAMALLEEDNDVTLQDFKCLLNYARNGCVAIVIGFECGEETGEAVFDISEHMDKQIGQCSEETRNEIKALGSVLEKIVTDEHENMDKAADRK